MVPFTYLKYTWHYTSTTIFSDSLDIKNELLYGVLTTVELYRFFFFFQWRKLKNGPSDQRPSLRRFSLCCTLFLRSNLLQIIIDSGGDSTRRKNQRPRKAQHTCGDWPFDGGLNDRSWGFTSQRNLMKFFFSKVSFLLGCPFLYSENRPSTQCYHKNWRWPSEQYLVVWKIIVTITISRID